MRSHHDPLVFKFLARMPRSRGDARIREALVAAARAFLAVLQGRELKIMPQITVGDPNATLQAVETSKGNPVAIAGTLNWSISPSDGSIAELAPDTAPNTVDTMLFVAKSAGDATVSVVDPQFGLTGTLVITVLAAPPPVPDTLSITFTPGT